MSEKTYLTCYLMTNGNLGMIEAKQLPEIIPKNRVSLVATTTNYTKEEVQKILNDCDTSVAKLILEEKFAWMDYLPGNKNL